MEKIYYKDERDSKVLIDFFCESVDRYYIEKKFDLTAAKEELVTELTRRYLNGYYRKLKTLTNSVLKSYLPERYEEIKSLILKCENVEVQTRFQQYMAMTPEFNYIAGSYDKIIPLKISVNTTGTIYYTLDGSDPDENSMIYTSPIFLESGEYQVEAVFVNDYGIKSNVARNWYMINLTVPE